MNFFANLIWLILGGLLTAALYIIAGLLMCVTIIGIPFGYQLIKLGIYALHPFGRDNDFAPGEPGCLSLVFNVLWIVGGWWEAALVHLFFGLLFCVTIVGIPFGIQHFKIAKMSLFPFGMTTRRS